MALMDRAEQQAQQPQKGPAFQRPDIGQFVPEEDQDAFARVVAAGIKFMVSPQMRDTVKEEVAREAPIPQKLSESTAGLMLSLDGQAEGGLPEGVIFPASMELMSEAADVLAAAGQTVTQADYNEAALALYAILGQRLGIDDEQLMAGAEQALPPEAGAEEMPPEQMPPEQPMQEGGMA